MAGETKANNKRRYQRVRLKPGKWVALQGGGRRETYRCTNMGLGGMFLDCSDPLPLESVVRFAFEFGSHTIRGLAVVRNATARGMGLAFLSLKTDDRSQVYLFLKHLAAKQAESDSELRNAHAKLA